MTQEAAPISSPRSLPRALLVQATSLCVGRTVELEQERLSIVRQHFGDVSLSRTCSVAPEPPRHNSRHSRLDGLWHSAKLLIPLSRRDVRVVEGARLESVCRGNSTVGSNPTLSASLRSLATSTARATAGKPSEGFHRSAEREGGPHSSIHRERASDGKVASTRHHRRRMARRRSAARWAETRRTASRHVRCVRRDPRPRRAGPLIETGEPRLVQLPAVSTK